MAPETDVAETVLNPDLADLTDDKLLAAFQRKHDSDTFTALVHRHHSMVFGVAKRMLGCPHAAEDVVQATFLVLAKNSHKIRKRCSLASWLYGVAYRISARSAKQRARSAVSTLKDEVMVTADPLEKLSRQFEQNTVFEELHRLPEKLRTPMVLRYLKGKSNSQVADEMRLSESAVEGRLKRGRNQLRLRLARQGVTFAAAVAMLEMLQRESAATVMPDLIAKCVTTSLSGKVPQTSGVETDIGNEVFQLAEQEIMKMATTKILNGAFIASVTLGLVSAGWGLSGSSLVMAQGDDPFGDVVVRSSSTAAAPATTATITQTAGRQTASIQERLKKLGHFSVDLIPESEIKILEELGKRTTLAFHDTSLEEAIGVIRAEHSIPILFDKRALQDESIDPASEVVAIDVSNIKLSNALKLMLDEHNLTTVIRNEVMLVTTKDVAEQTLITRVYRCRSGWRLTEPEMLEAITTAVAPDSWAEVGGPGSISIVNDGLVTRNSREVHDGINKLLAQFEKLYESPVSPNR